MTPLRSDRSTNPDTNIPAKLAMSSKSLESSPSENATLKQDFSPQSVLAFPKARTRKTKRPSKQRSCALLTDTPVKEAIES